MGLKVGDKVKVQYKPNSIGTIIGTVDESVKIIARDETQNFAKEKGDFIVEFENEIHKYYINPSFVTKIKE